MRFSLTTKFATATLAVLALSFLITSIATYHTVASEMAALVNGKVIPSLERGTASFQELFSNLLGQQQEAAKQQSREWFDLNGGNTVRALATRILPLLENYDYDGVAVLIRQAVEENPLILGARALTGEDLLTAGTFPESALLFEQAATSDFASVVVTLALSTQLLDASIARMEKQAVAAKIQMEQARGALATTIVTEAAASRGETSVYLRGVLATLGLGAMACLFAVLFVLVRRVVIGPLRKVQDGIARVADGDLTFRITVASKDELGALARSVDDMAGRIGELVREVKSSGMELAMMSEELSATTTHMAAASEQAASQAQNVATSAEEMSNTVGDVACNSAAVSAASIQARQVASEGVQVIGQTVEAVQGITAVVEEAAGTVRALSEQSQNISLVLEVIEDIADQTNLLALNAAIEAARAGESGRGFAVVADEVRKLAERTVRATQEISQTVNAIQAQSQSARTAMERGRKSVAQSKGLGERAGVSIRAIDDQVEVTVNQSAQIATATEEMAATAREVAVNMEEIAHGVNQTSQASTEISQTADTLAAKAEQLKRITERFKT